MRDLMAVGRAGPVKRLTKKRQATAKSEDDIAQLRHCKVAFASSESQSVDAAQSKPATEQHRTSAEHNSKMTLFERLTIRVGLAAVFLSFITLVALAVQVFVMYKTDVSVAKQAKLMEGQLAEMQSSSEQADRLIEANQKLANATVQSARVSDDALKLGQRAWVSVQSVRLEPPTPTIGQPLTIRVGIRNTGLTPAVRIVGTSVVDPVPEGAYPLFSHTKDRRVAVGMLAPQADHFFPMTVTTSISSGKPAPLTEPIFAYLVAGKARLYAHGRIDYADVFGDRHWITFCYRLTIPLNGNFELCAGHNETDDALRYKR
jgi:uncharacterized repeat protein (TIGR01451 family)